MIYYLYKHTNTPKDVNAQKGLDGHPCIRGDGLPLEHGGREKEVWGLWKQMLLEGDRCQAGEAELCAEF